MQHDLVRVVGRVPLESLAPVITNGISKNAAGLVECRCRDAPTHIGIPLEAVFGVFVPEVEGAITTGGAKRAVLWVKRDIVDGIHVGNVALGRVAVTFEGEVETVMR